MRNARMRVLGKMLRIRVEPDQATYGVPSDNPFVNNNSYRPEIWATGLRNPWRYSFDRETKDLWIADVGQGRAEEVNFQPAASKGGENYGWPRTEGLECYPPGSTCDRTAATLPILEYGRALGQSVTGGFVYRGSRYPDLRGFYLYGDFGSGNLWAVQRQGSTWDNRLVLATGRQISTFGEDETGELYLADYRGDIYLIAAGPPVASAARRSKCRKLSVRTVPRFTRHSFRTRADCATAHHTGGRISDSNGAGRNVAKVKWHRGASHRCRKRRWAGTDQLPGAV